RRQLEEEAEAAGPAALHSQLAEIDPASAQRLHPNDIRRVIRALEVMRLTGRPLSTWQQQGWWETKEPEATPVVSETPRCLAIDIPRNELVDRINRRVEIMMASGWIDEVRRLRKLPQPLSKEASQALGYREIAEYLEGKRQLPETIAEIQLRCRQFAKRQMTWFRNLSGCRLVEGKLTFDLWRVKI